jgi:type II secretory pathway component PulF
VSNTVDTPTNPEVLKILFAVRRLNDVREQLLAHRQRDGDLITAMRLLEVDRDILHGLECALALEENPTVRSMFDRTVRIAQETAEMVEFLQLRNAVQQAELEAAIHTIH